MVQVSETLSQDSIPNVHWVEPTPSSPLRGMYEVVHRLDRMSETSADRIDVTSWEIVRVETRGASAKLWIREPGGSSSRFDSDWLFKPAVEQANGSAIRIGDI